MYVDRCQVKQNGKSYQRVLIRESYRQDGKVKHRTIANLSACSEQEIQAIELAFKHKKDLDSLKKASDSPIQLRQGLSVGAVYLLHQLAQRLGLTHALGSDRQGQLALWQVLARVLDQGSRLSAVRLARAHAASEILGLEAFNEDHLYANLAWLTENQSRIEERLFKSLHPEGCPDVFLYDVTSSYLEGDHNALGAFGYNRDGKRGKKQIVVGLLCDGGGRALSIEVFAGNTNDPKTVGAQIRKAAQRFGAKAVTFVGDRGMIKGPQIQELGEENFHYITAITKPQIAVLLKKEVLQIELFEDCVAEVECVPEGVRYVLRRNPHRAREMQANRQGKKAALEKRLNAKNTYLQEHPKAQVATARRQVEDLAKKLRVHDWMSVQVQGRTLELREDEEALAEAGKLDGCYVIKTDLPATQASAQAVHDRYKDLTLVEQSFRTSKTVELELRPIYVQLEASTRGHVLVVMMAYRLVQYLQECWVSEDLTVQEGLNELSSLCLTEVVVKGAVVDQLIPAGRPQVKRLLELAQVEMPRKIRTRGTKVATKSKLPKHRTKRLK